MRLRQPFYVKDFKNFKAFFKNVKRHKCIRNIMRLLFTNVEPATFGLTTSATVEELREVFTKLRTYTVKEIVLGLAVIKVPTSVSDCRMLVKAHDRLCKTSNELGLHWQRCDQSRNPFAVLLNLEKSRLYPNKFQFNTDKKPVLAPASLLSIILNKHKNFAHTL